MTRSAIERLKVQLKEIGLEEPAESAERIWAMTEVLEDLLEKDGKTKAKTHIQNILFATFGLGLLAGEER